MTKAILTKEQALDYHREAWNWIAKACEEGDVNDDDTVASLLRKYCEAHNIPNGDPCCAYDTQIRDAVALYGTSCDFCPIKWGTENTHKNIFCCANGLGLYIRAQDAGYDRNWKQVSKFALEIAKLPERLKDDYVNKNTGE